MLVGTSLGQDASLCAVGRKCKPQPTIACAHDGALTIV
jgi:hypothetical protein